MGNSGPGPRHSSQRGLTELCGPSWHSVHPWRQETAPSSDWRAGRKAVGNIGSCRSLPLATFICEKQSARGGDVRRWWRLRMASGCDRRGSWPEPRSRACGKCWKPSSPLEYDWIRPPGSSLPSHWPWLGGKRFLQAVLLTLGCSVESLGQSVPHSEILIELVWDEVWALRMFKDSQMILIYSQSIP